MGATPRSQIDTEVLDALRGALYTKFRAIFVYTNRITGEIPLQPANEMRNAFDHFVTALSDDDIEEARRNIINACGHTILATIDCLAISVIHRLEIITNFVTVLDNAGAELPPDLRQEFIDSRAQAATLFARIAPLGVIGTQRPTADLDARTDIYNELLVLLRRFNRLYGKFGKIPEVEKRVRELAHAIWEREGKPQGKDHDHWRQAEKEIGRPPRLP